MDLTPVDRPGTADKLNEFLRQVVASYRNDDRSDAELLAQFAATSDQDAFRALVGRHGRSVWAACLAVVGESHGAEDAFQSVFIALARRSNSLDASKGIGPWLRAAARRAALRVRRGERRLDRLRDRLAAETSNETAVVARSSDESHTWVLTAEELERLPRRAREAVVMYHLEGRTLAQIAELLGCSITEAHRRVNSGVELLRKRLSARGVALTAGILAAMPGGLMTNTAAAATNAARGLSLPAPRVAALAEAILSPRFPSWLTAVVATLLLAAGTAVALVAYPSPRNPEPPSLSLTNSAVSSAAPADVTVGLELAPVPRPSSRVFRHDGAVTALVVSPDGKHVASAGTDRVIRVWDSATGKQVTLFDAPPEGVTALAFTSDGSVLVTDDPEIGVAFWDIATGARRDKRVGQAAGVAALTLSADGKRMVTIGHDSQLLSLNLTRPGENEFDRECTTKEQWTKSWSRAFRKEQPGNPSDERIGTAFAAAFTPDGRTAFAADCNQIMRLHVQSGRIDRLSLTKINSDLVKPVTTVAFSPDGRRLAWGNGDHQIGLADIAQSKSIGMLQGHESSVIALAFTRDGRTLASADADGWLICSTLPGPGVEFAARKSRTPFRAKVLTFAPNDRQLYGAGTDGVVRCWDTETLEPFKPNPGK